MIFPEKQSFHSVLPIAAGLVPVQATFKPSVQSPQSGWMERDLKQGVQRKTFRIGLEKLGLSET